MGVFTKDALPVGQKILVTIQGVILETVIEEVSPNKTYAKLKGLGWRRVDELKDIEPLEN